MSDDLDMGEDYDNKPVFCSFCYAELPAASEEWDCDKCGKSITEESHYLTSRQYLEACDAVERQAKEWTNAVRGKP